MIEGGYTARQTDLSFISIGLSVFVCFLVTLVPFAIGSPPVGQESLWMWLRQAVLAVVFGSLIISVYLIIRWRRNKLTETPIFQRIRARAAGPLGEEGEEVKAAELDRLPSQEEPGRD